MDSDGDSPGNYEDLYEMDQDEGSHAKLVEKIINLNKKPHLKKPSRTESALCVSEFHSVSEPNRLSVSELAKSLKNRKSRLKIGEKVKRLEKNAPTLPKPLEKPQANRIRRTFNYEKTRLQLDRWEATVTANRVSTDLSFPLNNDYKMEKKEAENFPTMWRAKSKLQEELEKIEPKVEEFHINLEQEKFPLTMKEMLARRREAAKLRAYQGYQEAKARRQKKIKSKKFHRIQKKEKIKKKLKEFEQLQKTNPEEALKKLEEIERSRAEERFSLRHKSTGKWARNQQIRAKYDRESRQNLTEQLILSKELTQKSKVDDSESEDEIVEEQIEKLPGADGDNPWIEGVKPGKEVAEFLTSYRKYWMGQNEGKSGENSEKDEIENTEKDSEEVEEAENEECFEDNNVEKTKTIGKRNMTDRRRRNVSEESIEEGKTAKTPKGKKRKVEKKICLTPSSKGGTLQEDAERLGEEEEEEDVMEALNSLDSKLEKAMVKKALQLKDQLSPKESSKKKKKKKTKQNKKSKLEMSLPTHKKAPQLDEALLQSTNKESDGTTNDQDILKLKNILSSNSKPSKPETNVNLDPQKHMKVATNLPTAIPDLLSTEENEEGVNQHAVIMEAFENDDIVEDFNKDKNDEIDKDRPKNIDLNLPGWGSWGGTNIKPNRRKKRRFILKAPPKVPRRDDNKGFLIVNEKAQSTVKEHMVAEVPFPFKNVKDFESSMRMPIGNTFIPETAFKRLIKPAVQTKMGAIIEPISKDILLNKNG